jgi:two-component system phosphate regulon sensor histidine kinase PhoR
LNRTSFLLKFLAGLAALLLVTQTLLLLFFTQRIRQDLEDTTLTSLRTSALLLREWARPELSLLFQGKNVDILGRVSNRAGYRISLVDAKGVLLQDTHLTPGIFGDEGHSSELDQARETGEGWSSRYSKVMDKPLLTYALAFHDNGPLLGFIRIATPLDVLNKTLDGLFAFFLSASFAALGLVFLLAWFYSRDFSRSMSTLIRNSGSFARGETYEKVYVTRPRELRLLSLGLNKLYDQLEDRIGTVNRQRDELAAILAGMVEAVIVLDNQLMIKTLNPAARRVFPFDREPVTLSLIEVCRNSALDEFARGLLSGDGGTGRTEIVLRDLETTLQVQGATLINQRGDRWGAVLVMIDITQLKRLEAMRRDFVSNVSHELKTPITNILGYVETLADGAIEDPARAKPFLDTILRHAGRLSLIVDDLLILTRLENSPPQEGEKKDVDLAELIAGALPLVDAKAKQRKIEIGNKFPRTRLTASVYPLLMEQALVNLVDNAVKFSPVGSKVTVALKAHRDSNEAEIRVDDEGPGIPEADKPRIFERFYRTEKGRSTPGTGLGLAIVKHILNLHRGTVAVESPVPNTDVGTRFTLKFPLN